MTVWTVPKDGTGKRERTGACCDCIGSAEEVEPGVQVAGSRAGCASAVLALPPPLRTVFRLLPRPPADSIAPPTMFLAPLKYPPVDVMVLLLPKKLVAKSE